MCVWFLVSLETDRGPGAAGTASQRAIQEGQEEEQEEEEGCRRFLGCGCRGRGHGRLINRRLGVSNTVYVQVNVKISGAHCTGLQSAAGTKGDSLLARRSRDKTHALHGEILSAAMLENTAQVQVGSR